MQLIWIPAQRRYYEGTQTEAKKAKLAFELREVPIVKAELIAFLNAREEEGDANQAVDMTAGDDDEADKVPAPIVPTTASPAPPHASTPMQSAVELSDRIAELEPKELAPVLSAAIGRLGEVAGHRGWAVFAKNVYAWTPAAKTVEQGLGMLFLAAMDTLRQEPGEKPRPIEPTGGE